MAGMDVYAAPEKRRPKTATLPNPTVKSAAPRFPAIADKPGKVRRTAANFDLADRGTEAWPINAPLASRNVTLTVVGIGLGFTSATAVV